MAIKLSNELDSSARLPRTFSQGPGSCPRRRAENSQNSLLSGAMASVPAALPNRTSCPSFPPQPPFYSQPAPPHPPYPRRPRSEPIRGASSTDWRTCTDTATTGQQPGALRSRLRMRRSCVRGPRPLHF